MNIFVSCNSWIRKQHSVITAIYNYVFFATIFLFLQVNLFEEFRIEGKDEHNNIYLELNPDNLAKAMKSAQNAQTVKIKLTKKHTACLTFEIILVRKDSCVCVPV